MKIIIRLSQRKFTMIYSDLRKVLKVTVKVNHKKELIWNNITLTNAYPDMNAWSYACLNRESIVRYIKLISGSIIKFL